MMLWRCQIAGSTPETTSWREVVAAADDVVDSDDPCTLLPYWWLAMPLMNY